MAQRGDHLDQSKRNHSHHAAVNSSVAAAAAPQYKHAAAPIKRPHHTLVSTNLPTHHSAHAAAASNHVAAASCAAAASYSHHHNNRAQHQSRPTHRIPVRDFLYGFQYAILPPTYREMADWLLTQPPIPAAQRLSDDDEADGDGDDFIDDLMPEDLDAYDRLHDPNFKKCEIDEDDEYAQNDEKSDGMNGYELPSVSTLASKQRPSTSLSPARSAAAASAQTTPTKRSVKRKIAQSANNSNAAAAVVSSPNVHAAAISSPRAAAAASTSSAATSPSIISPHRGNHNRSPTTTTKMIGRSIFEYPSQSDSPQPMDLDESVHAANQVLPAAVAAATPVAQPIAPAAVATLHSTPEVIVIDSSEESDGDNPDDELNESDDAHVLLPLAHNHSDHDDEEEQEAEAEAEVPSIPSTSSVKIPATPSQASIVIPPSASQPSSNSGGVASVSLTSTPIVHERTAAAAVNSPSRVPPAVQLTHDTGATRSLPPATTTTDEHDHGHDDSKDSLDLPRHAPTSRRLLHQDNAYHASDVQFFEIERDMQLMDQEVSRLSQLQSTPAATATGVVVDAESNRHIMNDGMTSSPSFHSSPVSTPPRASFHHSYELSRASMQLASTQPPQPLQSPHQAQIGDDEMFLHLSPQADSTQTPPRSPKTAEPAPIDAHPPASPDQSSLSLELTFDGDE